MFELFPDQPVYEYSQIVNLTYSFIWSFVLASIIAITHRLTHSGEHYPKNFFQSLILGAIVTTMVMMAIGDSLARGLGVFGAMAIIRFRTRIDDPRDVLFLFSALSTGLAIGVFGFSISFVGTMLFCLAAVILHFSPFKSYARHNDLVFALTDNKRLSHIVQIIKDHCQDYHVVSISYTKENTKRYRYAIVLKKNKTKDDLLEALHSISEIIQLRISINEINIP